MALVTLHRYKIIGANWENAPLEKVSKIASEINKLKFQGDSIERQYGFTQCESYKNNILYGIFIQKFPTTLKDYHPETKKEIKEETVDSGSYYYIVNLQEHEVFLQVRRDSHLPGKENIISKFRDLLKIALGKVGLGINDIKETKDEINREKIVKLFYDDADDVIEMELTDFDSNIIEEQKKSRGGARQTYFNPKEEYQEAMEEGALKFAQSVEKAHIKSKKGESLKKNPIARAMLEGSKKPTKFVYRKEDSIITTSAVVSRKFEVYIDGEKLSFAQQIEDILKELEPLKRRQIASSKAKDSQQEKLF